MSPSSPWADGPLPLIDTPSKTQNISKHNATYIASELAHAHNCMTRGSISSQAPHADLAFFCRTLCAWVVSHQQLEERLLFPEIDRLRRGAASSMAVYIEQHRACAPGLETLDSLRSPLEQHLKDEVGTLLELDKDCDSDVLLRIWRVVENAVG